MRRFTHIFGLVALVSFVACDEDEAAPADETPEVTPEPDAPVSPGEPGLATEPSGRRVLRAPGLEGRELTASPQTYTHEEGLVAVPYHLAGEVYTNASDHHEVRGIVRRGTPIEVGRRLFGPGCEGGAWYEIAPFGAVCTARGFNVSSEVDDRDLWVHPPDVDTTQPFRYVKAEDGAPRFFRVPTAEEEAQCEAAAAGDGPWPEVVDEPMNGVFLLAIAEEAEGESGTYLRTVANRWVRATDVEDKPVVTMRGELLGDGAELPLAFVYFEDRPLFAVEGETAREVGVAQKHARFPFVEEREIDGVSYVLGPDGIAVPSEGVRVVRAFERPADRIPADVKWIHVDLAEQTLVAYEGDTPVLATLVSSGKEGYDTPRGTFQIGEKYISITMNGDDPIEGFYEVEEVPWTMYYWNSYALHGAYWHDGFGQVRSHGCTNIPPADARWLYHWTTPEVPGGWHGVRRRRGTWVHFTR